MANVLIEQITESNLTDKKILDFVEKLKYSHTAWQECLDRLIRNAVPNDTTKFVMLQVVESFVKQTYSTSCNEEQEKVRLLLFQWIETQCTDAYSTEQPFILNKIAQVFSEVFVRDYPVRWPTFFSDLIKTLDLGEKAIDIYLRILAAIHVEIADNSTKRIKEELERNAYIKDAMRDLAVPEVVSSLHKILVSFGTNSDIVNQCLRVIGSYSMWIDKSFTINDIFFNDLVVLLTIHSVREETVNCISELVKKGMNPIEKLSMMRILIHLLTKNNVFVPSLKDATNFTFAVATLVNTIGIQLIFSFKRIEKAIDQIELHQWRLEIDNFAPTAMNFIQHDDDGVARVTVDFLREYLHFVKGNELQNYHMETLKSLLYVITEKSKYKETFRFGVEEDYETAFLELRKELLVLLQNIMLINRELTMEYAYNYMIQVVNVWQNMKFQDIEIGIKLFCCTHEFKFGQDESNFSPNETYTHVTGLVMTSLTTSALSAYPHEAVTLTIFETVVACNAYFRSNTDYIQPALTVFTDNRGMQNPNPRIRIRAAEFFIKLVKAIKSCIHPMVARNVLETLGDYLVVSVPWNESAQQWLNKEAQLCIYEAAGILIISGSYQEDMLSSAFAELISPLLRTSNSIIENLSGKSSIKVRSSLSEFLCHYISLALQTTKAFEGDKTVKLCGCSQLYITCLTLFLNALEGPFSSHNLTYTVQQFIHRMVVCMDNELLPYIPVAMQNLLNVSNCNTIEKCIPLLIQVITKFKKKATPFLQDALLGTFTAILQALTVPLQEKDENAQRAKQRLQKSFFQLMLSILQNGLIELLANEPNSLLEHLMKSVTAACEEFTDNAIRNLGFKILTRIVELGGTEIQINYFQEYLYSKIIPLCFRVPLDKSFDLGDPKYLGVLHEIAQCLQTILAKENDQFIDYLTQSYMPTNNVSPEETQEFCNALSSDNDYFKTYFNEFAIRAKTKFCSS